MGSTCKRVATCFCGGLDLTPGWGLVVFTRHERTCEKTHAINGVSLVSQTLCLYCGQSLIADTY